MISIPKRELLLSCISPAHSLVISARGFLPPYSWGRMSTPPSLVTSLSRLLCTENLFLIFALSSVLQNSNTAHMGKGSMRRFMSLCLMGRFFSQIENTFPTSCGVQMERWDKVSPEQSNM